MPFRVGQTLRHRYQILGELSQLTRHAHGNFGTIYLARDPVENRIVVIKESKTTDPAVQNALLEEIKLLTTMKHPHVPQLFDYFHSDEQRLCMVMEYVIGKSLQSLYAEGHPLDIAITIDWICQVLDVLARIHSHAPPMIHCDVKLDNIQIHSATSRAYLLDFGIATPAYAVSSQLGTPPFAAPEQYMADPLTPAVDTYAVGVCLYMLLTGQTPRDGLLHTQQDLISPRALNPAIPLALERIIVCALAVDPERRYPNAQSMLEALRVVPVVKHTSRRREASIDDRSQSPRRRASSEQKRARRPRRRSVQLKLVAKDRHILRLAPPLAVAAASAPAEPLAQPTQLTPQPLDPMLTVWQSRYFWMVGYILLSLIPYALLVIPAAYVASTIRYGTILCGSYPLVAIALVALWHIRTRGMFFEKRHLMWIAVFVLYSMLIDRLSIIFSEPQALQSLDVMSDFSLSMLLMMIQGVIVGALVVCCRRSLRLERRLEME